MKKIIILTLLWILFVSYYIVYAEEYTAKEICDVIYIIEGKDKARQPFGIETIECKTYQRCEQVCHNTVNNNKIRFKNQNKEKDFLTFLSKKYCPSNSVNWLKMLNYYLKKF